MHPCVDFLIHGEDELIFANLLRELASGGCLEVIKVLPPPNHDFEEGLFSLNKGLSSLNS